MEVPDVSYARSGDNAIAYQTVGDGPPDLVLLPFLANIYTLWQAPKFEAMARRLATGRRLILVNPRGVGLSDRPRGFTVETRMDDVLAVLDDLRVERPALLGLAESAASCAVLAASYPTGSNVSSCTRRGSAAYPTSVSATTRWVEYAADGRAGGVETCSSSSPATSILNGRTIRNT